MAEPFATFQSFLSEIDGQQPSSQSYALGTGAPTAPAPATISPESPTPTAAPATATAPPPPAGTIAGLGADIERQRAALTGAQTQFQEQAGPSRSAEDLDIAGTVSSALGGGPTEPVRSLVGARYTGPTGLDRDTLDQITQAFTRLQPQATSLTTLPGIEQGLRAETAGLTAGQRRQESLGRFSDPSYRARAGEQQEALRQFTTDFFQQQRAAQQFAQQRAAEEAGIAEATRGALGSAQASLTGALGARATEVSGRDAALRAAYDKWTQTGDPADLAALDALAPEDLSVFGTAEQARLKQAQAARTAIMDDPRFASIRDIPVLGLGVTRKGREALFLSKEDQAKLRAAGRTTREIKEIQTLARQRQHELERLFSPGTAQRAVASQDVAGQGFKANLEAGQFADILPLYFKESIYGGGSPVREFAPEDPRSFINFNEAAAPTPAGVATPEEITRYNLISELLGSPATMAPTLQYTPAGLSVDAERYTTAEQKRLEAQRSTIEKNRKEWLGRISSLRRRYSRAQKAKTLSTVGSVVGGILGFGALGGGTVGGAALGGYLGGQIGEEIV